MKLGRATGAGGQMAEHLSCAYQNLGFHLCVLFRDMAAHSFASRKFAACEGSLLIWIVYT